MWIFQQICRVKNKERFWGLIKSKVITKSKAPPRSHSGNAVTQCQCSFLQAAHGNWKGKREKWLSFSTFPFFNATEKSVCMPFCPKVWTSFSRRHLEWTASFWENRINHFLHGRKNIYIKTCCSAKANIQKSDNQIKFPEVMWEKMKYMSFQMTVILEQAKHLRFCFVLQWFALSL